MTAKYPRVQRHISRANTEALLSQADIDPDAKISKWINEMRTARQVPNSRVLCTKNVWRYSNAAICEGFIRPEVEQGGVRVAIADEHINAESTAALWIRAATAEIPDRRPSSSPATRPSLSRPRRGEAAGRIRPRQVQSLPGSWAAKAAIPADGALSASGWNRLRECGGPAAPSGSAGPLWRSPWPAPAPG